MYAFPNAKISAGTIVVYAQDLSVLSDEVLQAAVIKCRRVYRFLPSIAEVMEQADNLVEIATGTKQKTPDEAWNEVLKQMNEAFIYKKPVFSTPEIEFAALAMGWTGICETDTKNMGTIRAQFLKLYESTCKRKHDAKVNDQVLQLVSNIGIKMIK